MSQSASQTRENTPQDEPVAGAQDASPTNTGETDVSPTNEGTRPDGGSVSTGAWADAKTDPVSTGPNVTDTIAGRNDSAQS